MKISNAPVTVDKGNVIASDGMTSFSKSLLQAMHGFRFSTSALHKNA